MPTQDSSQENVPSPFEVVTPGKSKKSSKGIIIALVVVLFLALGIFAGVLLIKQNQNVAEKASGDASCPAAQKCPTADGKVLLNCTPPEADGSPKGSYCTPNFKGRVESCGGKSYCCNGTRWSQEMGACASASPSSTATSTATATATSTSTSSSTSTATSTSKSTSTAKATTTPTKPPVPVTGTDWPTYAGAGLGILVIIGSFLLAF